MPTSNAGPATPTSSLQPPAFLRAAVYCGPDAGFELREFPCPVPGPGETLLRVRLAGICASDLHTVQGRRREDTPLILGHEIVGEIAEIGRGGTRDATGTALSVGDRVTFSILVSCGSCDRCQSGLVQKCRALFKFGHRCVTKTPALSGGFSEYVLLPARTVIVSLPDELPDEAACSANCATATAAAGLRTVGLREGDSILIQGAGLLGLSAAAMARSAGASHVIVVDVDEARLESAKGFGASATMNWSRGGASELSRMVADLTRGQGVDRAIEACGRPEVIPAGMEALRIGGSYVWIGSVWEGAIASVDVNQAIRKLIRIHGLHNYRPEDLRTAVEFLSAQWRNYGFGQVVGRIMDLGQVDEAFSMAGKGDVLRVGIRPVVKHPRAR